MREPSKPRTVLGVGWAFLDALVQLETYPAEDSKTSVPPVRYDVGGPVPRALIALSAMTSDYRLALVASLGNDPQGRFLVNSLRRRRIDPLLHLGSREKTRTSTAWLTTDSGSRTVAYDGSESPSHRLPTTASSLLTSDRDVLHLDGRDVDCAIAACSRAQEVGAHIVVDVGSSKTGLMNILQYANTLILPRATLTSLLPGSHREVLTGRDLLKSLDCERLFLTAGRSTILAIDPQESLSLQPFSVPTKDSNGAGDVFAAGVLLGHLRNWSLGKTLHVAAAAAALKCTVLGNKGLASLGQIRDFLELRRADRGEWAQ